VAQSVLYGILTEVQSQIQALGLSGMPSANVQIVDVPVSAIQSLVTSKGFPAVIIAAFGGEGIVPANNLRDDVTYHVLVALCDSLKRDNEQPGDKNSASDQRLFWREAVRKAFSNQRLTSTVGMTMKVNPGAMVEPVFHKLGLWVSGFTIDITNREGRT